MSLLLASRARSHLVVMTDGYSLRLDEDGKTLQVTREDLQKVFASKERPFVVAHHGLNRVGAFGCDTLLPRLIEEDLDTLWSRGLNPCVAKVIESLDSAVSQQFKAVKNPGVFGIWLAGLWPCSDIPETAEIVWFKPGPSRVRVEVKTHGDVVWGGGGAKFVGDLASAWLKEKKDAERLFNGPAEISMEFIKKLYAAGLEKQKAAGERVFGGKARMALITEHGVDLGEV